MRVLGVAEGEVETVSGKRDEDERNLRFIGLIAFSDPPRPGVAEALRECRKAGIRVVMITGDHPLTAHAIAEALSIPHDPDRPVATGEEIDAADDESLQRLVSQVSIFARTRPEQKYRLVRAFRANGQVVAMTGDGVNDAPALREADIGVAMGERGTPVAREAAAMVLLDDNFSTIVGAVRDGRRIFENLQHAFSYLIAFHIPLLLSALLLPLLGYPLMLLPVHLILLEIILHPTVSLVFEAEPAPPDVMQRGPRRPGQGLLPLSSVIRPVLAGLSLAAGVIILYVWRLSGGEPVEQARSMGLATLVLGQALLVLGERSTKAPAWQVLDLTNKVLPFIFGGLVVALAGLIYLPSIARLLGTAALDLRSWAIIVPVALLTSLWPELLKAMRNRSNG